MYRCGTLLHIGHAYKYSVRLCVCASVHLCVCVRASLRAAGRVGIQCHVTKTARNINLKISSWRCQSRPFIAMSQPLRTESYTEKPTTRQRPSTFVKRCVK